MKLAVCWARFAKIQNDRTNQSITDKQIQARIIREGGGGVGGGG